VRLNAIMPEYRQRIALRSMAFPLELGDGEPPPRDILEQEWWLAALQEPRAEFRPFRGDHFPTTTLPAFDAAKAAERQGEDVGHAYDLRIRRAFFAESADIGNPDLLRALAQEVRLDMGRFDQDLASGQPREQVLAEWHLGREQLGVRGTPTLVLPDNTRARLPIAGPRLRDRRVIGVPPLPCCGDGCLDAMRHLLDQAVNG
jgi:predicted DsbA family dithiol-disulfide isomerase